MGVTCDDFVALFFLLFFALPDLLFDFVSVVCEIEPDCANALGAMHSPKACANTTLSTQTSLNRPTDIRTPIKTREQVLHQRVTVAIAS